MWREAPRAVIVTSRSLAEAATAMSRSFQDAAGIAQRSAGLGAVLELRSVRRSCEGPVSRQDAARKAAIASEAVLTSSGRTKPPHRQRPPAAAQTARTQDRPVSGLQRARRPPPFEPTAGSRPRATLRAVGSTPRRSHSLPSGVTVTGTATALQVAHDHAVFEQAVIGPRTDVFVLPARGARLFTKERWSERRADAIVGSQRRDQAIEPRGSKRNRAGRSMERTGRLRGTIVPRRSTPSSRPSTCTLTRHSGESKTSSTRFGRRRDGPRPFGPLLRRTPRGRRATNRPRTAPATAHAHPRGRSRRALPACRTSIKVPEAGRSPTSQAPPRIRIGSPAPIDASVSNRTATSSRFVIV